MEKLESMYSVGWVLVCFLFFLGVHFIEALLLLVAENIELIILYSVIQEVIIIFEASARL